jgi:hypothetical protein
MEDGARKNALSPAAFSRNVSTIFDSDRSIWRIVGGFEAKDLLPGTQPSNSSEHPASVEPQEQSWPRSRAHEKAGLKSRPERKTRLKQAAR